MPGRITDSVYLVPKRIDTFHPRHIKVKILHIKETLPEEVKLENCAFGLDFCDVTSTWRHPDC